MNASDIMTTDVVTVGLTTKVSEIAKILLERRISAVPVTDPDGSLIGIVSEGDLMRRSETETITQRSWWLEYFTFSYDLQAEFIKTHARTAAEVMTPNPISVSPETPVNEIAAILEKHRIKRVPVLQDRAIVGIVSRANLLQGLAASKVVPDVVRVDDAELRKRVIKAIQEHDGFEAPLVNVIVIEGHVQLWGYADSEIEERTITLAAELVPGVVAVENHLSRMQGWSTGAE